MWWTWVKEIVRQSFYSPGVWKLRRLSSTGSVGWWDGISLLLGKLLFLESDSVLFLWKNKSQCKTCCHWSLCITTQVHCNIFATICTPVHYISIIFTRDAPAFAHVQNLFLISPNSRKTSFWHAVLQVRKGMVSWPGYDASPSFLTNRESGWKVMTKSWLFSQSGRWRWLWPEILQGEW